MNTRPSLVRSIPFWALLAGSAATAATGAFLLVDKLGTMTTELTDGTATNVTVYVGQTTAIVGGILLGAGVIGVLLALAVAAVSTLRPHAPVEVVEPLDWTEADVQDDVAPVDAPAVVAPAVDEPAAAEPGVAPAR
ncbi:dinucleotide-utilizing enzyme [Microbacterium sp. CFBP9034]|uniref:dinucleotide-utilizing enzyme n=1 Tax=Microbacterium sp. CFBP9034 TaxID=3096540 RepID=UPI002A6B257C|nr:dinucleotide-utilizing enzyme [Microbacterium sp. CFBP9034]MDY0909900.1 dinucleotide-utilizing enzyme [Microbacterium sp. CFBP9034]